MTEDQARAMQRASIELARARRKMRKLFATLFPAGSIVQFRRGNWNYSGLVTGYSEDGEYILARAARAGSVRYQIKPTEILDGAK